MSHFFRKLFARWFEGPSAEAGLIGGEEDFIDLTLPLVEAARGDDRTTVIIARGTIEGVLVGFRVDMGHDWTSTPTSGASDQNFYWGKAAVRSIGADSDRFLALLAKLYALPAPDKPMAQCIDVKVVGLAADPTKIMTDRVATKLFFMSSEGEEAEVYLNIDAPSQRIELREKDFDYRENLIRALAGWN